MNTEKIPLTKVIQITDTHLFEKNDQEIFGVKSNHQFERCIQNIITSDLQDTDYIFLTGDVSQDHTQQSYHFAAHLLSTLQVPIYWIPGNHDDKKSMAGVFSMYSPFVNNRTLSFPGWDIIFLDTNRANSASGYLSDEESIALKNTLASCDKNKHVALVMHHHPIAVGTPLIDQYILKNNDTLWNIITRTNVKLIICGHVHGDYHLIHNNISLHASPATCLQWKKGTEKLSTINKIGYKIHFFTKTHSAVARVI